MKILRFKHGFHRRLYRVARGGVPLSGGGIARERAFINIYRLRAKIPQPHQRCSRFGLHWRKYELHMLLDGLMTYDNTELNLIHDYLL